MVNKVVADLPEKSRPAFVGTFLFLGYTWGVTPPVDADSNFWEHDAVALTLAAGEALLDDQRFTAFVVDEAQDFADSLWPALLSSAASHDFKLAVFRDDEQTVLSDRRSRPDLPLVQLVLDDNLRNSRQIVDTFRPLVDAEITEKGGSSFPVEYIDCAADEVISAADDVVADLLENRGWITEHVAALTTQHRHPVHVELGDDKTAYWKELWATDDVFYSTAAGSTTNVARGSPVATPLVIALAAPGVLSGSSAGFASTITSVSAAARASSLRRFSVSSRRSPELAGCACAIDSLSPLLASLAAGRVVGVAWLIPSSRTSAAKRPCAAASLRSGLIASRIPALVSA